jgi:hypothetical protein
MTATCSKQAAGAAAGVLMAELNMQTTLFTQQQTKRHQ